MTMLQRTGRLYAYALTVGAVAACSQLGSLGNVLGGVLGTGNQVAGMIRSVDTRSQQISVQDQSGQTVALAYDNQTKVVYGSRYYSVTNLEYGDQVSAHVQQLQNGGYYTDSVQVTQPANSSGSTTSGSQVQSLQGTVRAIDHTNALFTVDVGNGTTLTVSIPYNASSNDVNTFNNLRSGDYVRFYGVYVTNSRVELRNFY